MRKYFRDCRTIEDVKAEYRKLAKRLHPDCGGDAAEFKAMMDDYRMAYNLYKGVHKTADGETYEKEEDTTQTADQYADLINALLMMDGVTIELIGSWIWLSGNTYAHKDAIKNLHFWYSKSKKAWYHNGATEYRKRRGHYNMSQIKAKYGCRAIRARAAATLEEK